MLNNPINTAQKLKDKLKEMEGKINREDRLIYFQSLKATLTAKKEEWQNEIEFLERVKRFDRGILLMFMNGRNQRRTIRFEDIFSEFGIYERIISLKKAVEIANG